MDGEDPCGLLECAGPYGDPQQVFGVRAEQGEVDLVGRAQDLAADEGVEASAGGERGAASRAAAIRRSVSSSVWRMICILSRGYGVFSMQWGARCR
ncbi:hypothetical protein [Streptomyces sp. A1-5]|uniref:hypothetical protein n=1 Tax=Streptomyces sp. A1-5 TaxID=2738410 RepID=UPI001F2D54AA|nr:hypothetical protein [Streptomyces sp. A1-5]